MYTAYNTPFLCNLHVKNIVSMDTHNCIFKSSSGPSDLRGKVPISTEMMGQGGRVGML